MAAIKGGRKTRIDFTSVASVPVGIGLILVGQAAEGGSVGSILQSTAALIVFGGTLGAVLLSFSMVDVRRALKALRTVFLWDGEPADRTIETMVEFAIQARKSGIMSLEDDLPDIADPFLSKAIGLAVDGTNPDKLRDMLETENETREEYDDIPAKVYEAAGGYAPTIGILGAVLGLIHVMQNLTDPGKLGSGIAVAFVSTVYGVGSANLLFLPIATKLKMKARYEARRRELILEGTLAIQEGLNPQTVREKLRGFASPTAKADSLQKVA